MYSQDAASLWTIYESLQAQLAAVIAQKAVVLTAIAGIINSGNSDISSISEGDGMSSASYTLITLQSRFDSFVLAEERVAKTMESIRQLAIEAEPGLFSARVSVSRPADCILNQ